MFKCIPYTVIHILHLFTFTTLLDLSYGKIEYPPSHCSICYIMLCKSYPFNHIYSLSTHCIFLFINFNHAKLLTTNDHFVSVLSFPLFVLHTAVTFVHFCLFAPKCFYFLYSTKKGIPYWVYTG